MCCAQLTFTLMIFFIIGPIGAPINSLEQTVRHSLDEEKVHITEKWMIPSFTLRDFCIINSVLLEVHYYHYTITN